MPSMLNGLSVSNQVNLLPKKVIKKPAPKKRGETLDDLTLDDEAEEIEIVEPEDASPDVEVNKPSKAMEQEKWMKHCLLRRGLE